MDELKDVLGVAGGNKALQIQLDQKDMLIMGGILLVAVYLGTLLARVTVK